MSYDALSQQLELLAQKLRKQSSNLQGNTLATAAVSLSKSLSGFDKKLDAFIKGNDPSIEAIQTILKSPAKKLLKLPVWIKLHRCVFKSKPEGETAAKLQKAYVDAAKDQNKAETAYKALDQMVKELSVASAPIPKDKAALQSEFLRLGGLDEEDALIELSKRWTTPNLKKLAEHNAISVTSKAKRERLEREILHYARRAYTNISH